MSSISSISGNGAFYSRPVKRRSEGVSAQPKNYEQLKTVKKNNEETSFNLQSNKEKLRETYKPGIRHNSEKAVMAFVSHLQKIPPSSDKVSNTYHQVGNFEKQQEVKNMFGVDLYA